MKPLFDFLLKLCILSLVLWGAILYALDPSSVDYYSIFIAWVMMFSNTLVGYLLFEYAIDKDSVVFNKIVFGGLALRLLALMVLVAIFIVGKLVAVNDFVFSVFAFYCIYVVVEILGYQKKNKQKKN
uniref:Uncharacterized protein n=1 Tax=Chlorobium chlorochromatii (strain CaD3) TaxID=340177 RepID=Q3ANW7_CHLCH